MSSELSYARSGSRRVEAVTPVATSAIQNIDTEINDAR